MAVSTTKPYRNTKVVMYTSSYSVSANGNTNIDVNPSESGWTPIGIVGFSTGHGSVVVQQSRMADASTARTTVRNLTSSTVTPTAYTYILFVKS